MAATDLYAGMGPGVNSPCRHAAVVTPSDSTDLTYVSVLFIGGSGNVAVITAAGETVTIAGVVAGSVLPLRVSRVMSTNTTATNIVALA